MNNKITLIMFLAACVVANSAQAQMKLIARSVTQFAGGANTTQDSVIYFRSGTKTPAQYVNMPQYATGADSIHTYSLNGTKLEMTERQVFYWTSKTLDSVIVYENDNGEWKYDYKVEIAAIAGKPDTVRYRTRRNGGWSTSSYRIYTWSGNNAATITRVRRGWDKDKKEWVLSNDWKTTMTYSNNRTADSIFQDYSGGSFKNENKISYTYTTGGIATIDVSVPDGSNWKINHRSQYTYDGTNRLELIKSELLNGTAWEGDDSISYFYTGAKKSPDSFLHYQMQFNLFSPVAKHVIFANTDNQWTAERVESWNGTTSFDYSGSDTTINWYWGWNLSVDDVDAEKANLLSIYPTPASNNITIKLNDGMKNKNVEFAIIDMQGRTITKWSNANYQSAISISVADLPAGNYILHARNGNAVVAERFIISK